MCLKRILREGEKKLAENIALEDLYTGRYVPPDQSQITRFYEWQQYRSFLDSYGFTNLNIGDDELMFNLWKDSVDPTKPTIAQNAFSYRLNKLLGVGSSGSSGPSAAQRAAQIEAEIKNIAGQFGIQGDWSELASTAASNNWNAAMIRDHLAEMLNEEMINREGIVSSTASKVRQLAGQYYVNVSDSEVFDWAKRLAAEDIDEDTIMEQIKGRAKAKFSSLSEIIDSGTTVRDYFRPHRETIAQLMDLSPDQVDLVNDARWLPVLENLSGQERRPMNLYETGQYVRSLADWKETSSARNLASDVSVSVARIMGVLG